MKETFDIGRFEKYLLTDIKSLFNRRGISLISLSLAGVAANFVVLLFNLVLGDQYMGWDSSVRSLLFYFCGALAVILVPVRHYGIITDKRKGAEFLLMPASLLEKFISIIIVSVIVVPLTYCILYIGTDWLWSICDRTFDKSLFRYIVLESNMPLINFDFTDMHFFTLDDFASGILVFVLGGLFFRKSKIGKTFLVLLASGIVIGTAFIGLIDNETIYANISEDSLRLVDNINDTVILLLLLAGIWFRMKKIQL